MRTPQEIAIACIQHAIEHGQTVEGLLRTWQCGCEPDLGDGSVWINIAGGRLYPNKESSENIKVKPFQIGVSIYRKDGNNAYGIFDVREIWEELINPKPKQLSLFEVMS